MLLLTNNHKTMNIILTLLFGAIAGSFWAQWYGQILSALIGAVILLWVWNLIKKLLK